MPNPYARWIDRQENRLASRDNDRVVRPFEWGLEWLGLGTAAPDPARPPRIQPNYLSTPQDERVAIDAMRLVRRIVAQPPMARFHPEEFRPGAAATSDEDLLAAARALGTTIFHPAGTAKMGLASDPMAVTDAKLRVFGVEGLRVADASVMPAITSGNTNSPTMMIAEKAARMIGEDA